MKFSQKQSEFPAVELLRIDVGCLNYKLVLIVFQTLLSIMKNVCLKIRIDVHIVLEVLILNILGI